jgi:hypothetical protein
MTPQQQEAINQAMDALAGASWLRDVRPSKDILGNPAITVYYVDKSSSPSFLHGNLAPFRSKAGVPVIWERVDKANVSEDYYSDAMLIRKKDAKFVDLSRATPF